MKLFISVTAIFLLFTINATSSTASQNEVKNRLKRNIGENNTELEPTEAPKNLKLVRVLSGTNAIVSWIEVPPESVRGHFRGYKIQTWVENDEENVKEILMKPNTSRALIDKFTPDAMNYVRILAFNDHYNGPYSNILSFETPIVV